MCIRDRDFLARHHQFGPPATEQFREKSPKMVVDRIERILQQIAGFTVDAADGVFQRFHRLGEVCCLHVEVALALAGRVQFFELSLIHI